jgi:hypothetical protein
MLEFMSLAAIELGVPLLFSSVRYRSYLLVAVTEPLDVLRQGLRIVAIGPYHNISCGFAFPLSTPHSRIVTLGG